RFDSSVCGPCSFETGSVVRFWLWRSATGNSADRSRHLGVAKHPTAIDGIRPRKSGSHPDSPLEGTRFEPSVPRGKGPTLRVSVLFHSDFSVGGEPARGDIERLVVSRGTDGSNPVPSSGESVSLPHPLSKVQSP